MSDRKPSLIDLLGQYMRDAAPGGVLNPEVTGQGLLDAAALTTAPVPVAGDLVGLLADANRMRDPKERTALNYGLMALGALPFVPSGLRQAKKAIGKADDAKRAKTSFEVAHEVAQKNAALPVSQGGLGLPPNNTAMDRARAMGFDTPGWHGTDRDFNQFRRSDIGAQGPGVYLGDAPEVAATYAGDGKGSRTIPVMTRGPFLTNRTFSDLVHKHGWKGAEVAGKAAGYSGVHDTMFESALNVWEPKNIRSRFAAFDPMKRDSSDILASLAPYLITGGLAGLLGLPSDE